MKATIARALILAAASASSLALSSCETTGDPNAGGIFWSPTKAQQRLDDRQDHLDAIQSDTRATNRRSAATQRKINNY